MGHARITIRLCAPVLEWIQSHSDSRFVDAMVYPIFSLPARNMNPTMSVAEALSYGQIVRSPFILFQSKMTGRALKKSAESDTSPETEVGRRHMGSCPMGK
jgi:hypothetical protein